MHYGIETVKGADFRRVTLDDEARYGLLGKGAILMLTAYPNRTSPVLRGAWILDRLLGTPPPDAAARRPDAAGKQARPAGANAAGAARAAPRESDLLRLSRRDGSARACAGKLQRGGPVPQPRSRHAARRSTRPACCRMARRSTGPERSAPGARQPARSVRSGVHRESVDLCAGPQPRLSRHADGAPHRARRATDNYRFESIVLGIVSSDPSASGKARASRQTSPAQQTQASLQAHWLRRTSRAARCGTRRRSSRRSDPVLRRACASPSARRDSRPAPAPRGATACRAT